VILPSPLLLAIGLVLLGGSSGVVVSNLVAITEKKRLRKSVVSFILLAVSTSLPELLVAMNAIAVGTMTVSLGDILGSNIVNICLIIGVCFLVFSLKNSGKKKMVMGEKAMKQFTNALILLSATLLGLLYLQYMRRYIGVMLLGVFFVYSFRLFQKRKEDGDKNNVHARKEGIRKELVLIVIAIAGVIIGARFTVESAIDIAIYFGVPASIIGATLVAFGTGLPELTVDVRAAISGHLDIVIGDIVGSCFLNSTLVLGLLLTFTPYEGTVNLAVLSDLLLFGVVSNLILWYFLDNKKTGYQEGVILFSLYVVNVLSLLEILVLRVP
jgi:cation:H+ antiporter